MKYELRNIISGAGGVRNGTAIQAAARYLSGSKETSEMVKGQKHYKEKEAKVLREYIAKNNLWLPHINIEDYISEGAEQKVYLNDGKHVLKLNDSIYYNSWKDYLNNLLLHNYFFPDTAYELIGFTEEIKENKSILYAVVKQPFVKATTPTDLQSVEDFLINNGFLNTRNHDYFHPDLGIILEDLHDENVLTKDGTLHFIDTVFFITDVFYRD